MQEPVNSNVLNHTLGTRIRTNGPRINTMTYSTAMDAGNCSLAKYFRLSVTIFSDSVVATVLILGLVLSLIQSKSSDKYIGFCASYDEFIRFSFPLSKVNYTAHARTE